MPPYRLGVEDAVRRLSSRQVRPSGRPLVPGGIAAEGLDDAEGPEVRTLTRRTLEEPLRWIANNAGQEGNIVVGKVKELATEHVHNARDDRFENLIEAGVIDPTKVVRFAVQNSASVAALLLTTEAIVGDQPEKKKDSHMPSPGMDDY